MTRSTQPSDVKWAPVVMVVRLHASLGTTLLARRWALYRAATKGLFDFLARPPLHVFSCALRPAPRQRYAVMSPVSFALQLTNAIRAALTPAPDVRPDGVLVLLPPFSALNGEATSAFARSTIAVSRLWVKLRKGLRDATTFADLFHSATVYACALICRVPARLVELPR